MAIDDLYRVRYKFATSGVSWLTYLHYRITSQPSGPETTQDIVAAVNDHLTPKIEGVMDDQAIISNLTGYRILPIGRHPGWIPLAFADGGLLGIRLPGAVSALMRLQQSTRSARSNGRILFSGLNIVLQSSGHVTAAARAPAGPLGVLADTLAAEVPTIKGTTLGLVIMSRSQGPLLTPYGNPLPVSSVVCDPRTFVSPDRSPTPDGLGPLLESGPI